jgi:hypothetical protein
MSSKIETYHRNGLVGHSTECHVFARQNRLLHPPCEEWLPVRK